MIGLNCINPLIDSYFWGIGPYDFCESLQAKAWEKVYSGQSPGLILGGEITQTITQGVRARPEDICGHQDFEVVKIKRGGETTLHSPGQLVIYPVLNIRELKIGVRDYVRILLLISSKTFQSFGVDVIGSEDPVGLFSRMGKIGFCGLQIKQGISQHGLSLNISNELGLFDHIISCGLKKAQYDKLNSHISDITTEKFFSRWVETASLAGILQKNQSPATSSSQMDSDYSEFSSPELLIQDR